MSLIPFILDYDPWELRRYYPRRHYHETPWDQFGLGITPSDFRLLTSIPSMLFDAENQLMSKDSDYPQPVIGKDGFQVHMDVKQFKPNEINVKTIDNDSVIIEGKHEDRQDEHGYISRHFVRKYKLPKGYDVNQVQSTLSSDGVLTIKAPPPAKSIEDGKERNIQIQQTGPAHLNVKENKSEELEKKK